RSESSRSVSSSPGRHVALQLVQRARPVLLEQARESAIGEQPVAGLAAWAIVGLVLGVHDTLHGRAAVRARLTEAAVDGHVGAKGRDALGKFSGRLAAYPRDPVGQRRARRLEEALDLAVRQGPRELHGRQSRAMQDLVAVGVADA